jgi:uncharacterized protein YbjT (DUF2867 family)
MKVLVVGGTGVVGSAVVAALRAAGHQPRIMSRSADGAARLPPGTDYVQADLERPATLPPAFSGMDGVFLLAPIGRSETAQALAGVDAAKAAGLTRIVYLSALMPPGSEAIPHVASKIPVERAVQASGLPWTVLRPNHLFQTDAPLRDEIMTGGVYPQPLGARGLNRLDVRDLAEAAANAFTRGAGGIVPINGPRGLTGDDTARLYSECLRRPVRYAGDDLDVWEKAASAVSSPWVAHSLRMMYDYYIRHGAHASGRDFAAQENLLGRAPRPFETFVEEVAGEWSA